MLDIEQIYSVQRAHLYVRGALDLCLCVIRVKITSANVNLAVGQFSICRSQGSVYPDYNLRLISERKLFGTKCCLHLQALKRWFSTVKLHSVAFQRSTKFNVTFIFYKPCIILQYVYEPTRYTKFL